MDNYIDELYKLIINGDTTQNEFVSKIRDYMIKNS